MAEYRGTVGSKVRNYTTDPDNPIEGQVWYNTTDNVLKFQYPNLLSSWRTAGNLNDDVAYTLGLAERMLPALEECTECNQCVEKCPYHLPTPKRVKELEELLKSKKKGS